MAVAVMGDLVAAPQDLLHQRFSLIDDDARDEEGRLQPVTVEEIEHAAGSDFPAIGPLRHEDGTLGIARIAPGPHGLGIEIEGEE